MKLKGIKRRKPSFLVVNDGKLKIRRKQEFAHVRVNAFLHPEIRQEEFEGKQYIAVPMITIVEGVHNGSEGPLLYLDEELSRTPMMWDHKPIVLYHPTMNGKPISACDPEVLEEHKIGIQFNTVHEDGKNKAEAWLELAALERVDANLPPDVRILPRLQKGEMVELSTGLFFDREMSEGTWNGEDFVGIVRNIRPDHLAILPDKKGACSIADGAGLLRLNQEELLTNINQCVEAYMNKKELIDTLIANSDEWEESDRKALGGLDISMLKKLVAINKATGKEEDEDETSEGGTVKNAKGKAKKKVRVQRVVNEDEEDEEDGEFLINQIQQPQRKKKEQAETLDEVLANASPKLAMILTRSVAEFDRKTAKLVESLAANSRCPWTKEQLQKMDPSILEGLAIMANNGQPDEDHPVANYLGMGDIFAPRGMAFNGGQGVEEEPLGMPVYNFEGEDA